MAWYRAMLRGENFFLRLAGEIKRMGFYTTRWIEASSSEDAENRAIELIRSDAELRPQVLNAKNDPPMVYIEELAEVEEHDVPDIQQGFSFFPEEMNA
jgi:hypothetical protein